MTIPPLKLIALEITRRCNLSCKHCRGNSRNETYSNELSFDEITAILDNVKTFSKPIIIVTGGEPLGREDVFNITGYSSSLGFRTVLATCGHFLTDTVVKRLIEKGVSRISVSLDGARAETHDTFRGVPGAFGKALRGLETAHKLGLDFQINSTLTTLNIDELESLHNLAVSLGAVGFHPFLLVPMGRGSGLADSALSPSEYEDVLLRIAHIAAASPIEVKPTCSPHYYRVIRQQNISGTIDLPPQHIQQVSHGGHTLKHPVTKGCIGGQGFVFISHRGKVQICGFLEHEAGDLRTAGYDMKSIWENSELFREIRDLDNYHGKCGICEFRKVCGGCRARAFYHSGDYLGEEPNCIYIPKREKR